MSVLLNFNASKLPRTMMRQEWRAAHRWKRIVQRELNKRMDRMVSDAILFGSGTAIL